MPEVRLFRTADKKVPLLKWLKDVKDREPAVYEKCLARVLDLVTEGFRLQRPRAAPLRDGIYELRPKSGHVNYRILYFFIDGIAFLTEGLTKESEVPDSYINRTIEYKDLVATDKAKFSADLPDDFFGDKD
jgi:hypothetical protein